MRADPRAGVCVVGSINIDTTLQLSALPGPGETCLARGKHLSPGGKGANQAAAAAAVGSQVSVIGAVGDDQEGAAARHNLAARGIDTSSVATIRGSSTGAAVVLVSDDGENMVIVDPGANGLVSAEMVTSHLYKLSQEPLGIVLVQLEIPIEAVIAAAETKGAARLVLNPAPMPSSALELAPVLARTDVLVPNRTELAQLVNAPAPDTIEELDRCVARLPFAGILIITLGSDGAAIYMDGERQHLLQPNRVDAVDTSGAGDAFCGVLAHALAAGADLLDAATMANAMAARSTVYRGAQVPPAFAAESSR